MKKSIKWLLAALACVIAFALIYFLYNALQKSYAPNPFAGNTQSTSTPSNAQNSASSGQTEQSSQASVDAPDFTALNAQGEEVKLSDYFGKPIVLNFWATWCGYCKQEMPDFQQAYVDNSDVQFLMVNVTDGYQETLESAQKFIEDSGYEFPVLYDTKMEGASAYGAYGLPMTIFIDEDGKVVAYANGMLSAENLAKGIDMIQ